MVDIVIAMAVMVTIVVAVVAMLTTAISVAGCCVDCGVMSW